MIKRQPVPADTIERIERLAEHLRRDGLVVAAYLFGSFARGNQGPLSDVDLALLLDPAAGREDLGRLTLEYVAEITRRLGTDEVSLVVLNDAPLTVRHEVVRTGRVLVDNDPQSRLSFEARTEDLYMDFEPMLAAYDDELLRKLTAPPDDR